MNPNSPKQNIIKSIDSEKTDSESIELINNGRKNLKKNKTEELWPKGKDKEETENENKRASRRIVPQPQVKLIQSDSKPAEKEYKFEEPKKLEVTIQANQERKEYESRNKDELSRSNSMAEDGISIGGEESMASVQKNKKYGVKCQVELNNIDSITQTISLDIHLSIHFEWNQDKYKIPDKGIINDEEIIKKINPQIEILRTSSCELTLNVYLGTKHKTIYNIRKYRVILKERLELERFPYDRQVIKVFFQIFHGQFCLWEEPQNELPDTIIRDDSLKDKHLIAEYDGTEWSIDRVEGSIGMVNDSSIFAFRFCVSRSATYYLTNFVMVNFLIVGCASFTMAIETTDFSSRSQITITLLLTVVAFKFVMTTFLPKISYQTFFDIYNNYALFMLASVLLENFFVTSLYIPDENKAKHADRIFMYCFNSVWVGSHLIILLIHFCEGFYCKWETVIENDLKGITRGKGESTLSKENFARTTYLALAPSIQTQENIEKSNKISSRYKRTDSSNILNRPRSKAKNISLIADINDGVMVWENPLVSFNNSV